MNENYDSEIQQHAATNNYPVRLGIIGGGQLAKMTALAALPLGCEVLVLERNPFSPAARLSPGSMVGDWNDPDVLLKFASKVDVVTLENEFVDASALEALEKSGHQVFPSSASIARCQDKLIQKQGLEGVGLAVSEFRALSSPQEVETVGLKLGWPLVLKTRRNGYDGKGNYTLRSESDIHEGWRKLHGNHNELFVEKFCQFTKELAVMVTRGRNGDSVAYPVVETVQQDHVCHRVNAPATISNELKARAEEMASRAVEAMNGVGSFGVEMFLTATGDLLINELAPRVHNSGHYSIEGCECSQFENHVRAVLGWPLGSTRMVAPAAVMVNLLGKEKSPGNPRNLDAALLIRGAHLHLYGKAMSGIGRKMGHVTALGNSVEEAFHSAEQVANTIEFGL
jgi:5-(carboxyamino)imidazole ribonucleotide synthase